jgi:hypothetical protein
MPATSNDEGKKPEGPFSPGEVEYWLRQFTGNPSAEGPKSQIDRKSGH